MIFWMKLRLHLKCEFANEFYASNYFVRLMPWTDRVFSNHHLKCGKGGKIMDIPRSLAIYCAVV